MICWFCKGTGKLEVYDNFNSETGKWEFTGRYRSCHICHESGENPPLIGYATITERQGLGKFKHDWLYPFPTGTKVVVITESEYHLLKMNKN